VTAPCILELNAGLDGEECGSAGANGLTSASTGKSAAN
jgi:hypothetical protein